MIKSLVATRKRVFNLITGTNQLATISDVNTVIDGINNLINYRDADVSLKQTKQNNPVLKYMADGDPDCAECKGVLDVPLPAGDCKCGGGKKAAAALITGVTRTGVGLYTVAFNQNLPAMQNMVTRAGTVSVVAEAFSNPDHVLVVDKTNLPVSMVIKTYNRATLAYEDNILNDTVVKFRAYANWTK